MDFQLDEEQTMLRDASRRLLESLSGPADVRAALDAVDDADGRLWQAGAEMGWLGLAVPEAEGGFGRGVVEAAIVAEEIGRTTARGPFLPTMLVAVAVAGAGSTAAKELALAGLLDGSSPACWAFAEHGRPWSLAGVHATATSDGGDVVLTGTKTAVQDAAAARWLLVTALHHGEPASFLVDARAEGLTLRRQRVLDVTRHFYEVRLDGVRVPASHRLEGGPTEVLRLLDAAAVLTCAESLGMAARLMEMSVAYAKVRVQFGRPIGSFQAVKHHCANMRIRLQGIRASTYLAAMTLDADAAEPGFASSAKAFVSQAASDVAGDALQVHGGIGFTWEHDLHFYLRRTKVDEVLYGDVPTHREQALRRRLASVGA